MNIALVTTAKNEADILRLNLRYHRHLGVGLAYVFLDDSTDGTRASIANLDGVEIRESLTPSALDPATRHNPDLTRILDQLGVHHCARQMLNAYWASGDARARGFDWLVSLDADELLCPDLDQLPADALRHVLASIPTEIDAVRFLPLEVAQTRLNYSRSVFAEESLFQTIFAQEGNSVRQLDNPLQRPILDPSSGRVKPIAGYLGHTMGKVAVRLTREVVPSSVHGFTGSGQAPLRELLTGWLLHYNMYSFERFLAKYRSFSQHPDYFVGGAAVHWTLKVWRDMVNAPNAAEVDLRAYYQRWILLKAAELAAEMTRHSPRVVKVEAVRRIVAILGEG